MSQVREEDREGMSAMCLLAMEDESFGFSRRFVVVVVRRVVLLMTSREVWGFDCLPNERGNWALILSYIFASQLRFFRSSSSESFLYLHGDLAAVEEGGWFMGRVAPVGLTKFRFGLWTYGLWAEPLQ